jgi:DNA-binding NarL/FixJ family response regulator
MKKNDNLILVDDHNLFRDALKFIVEQSHRLNVISEASSGDELIEIFDTWAPYMVLMNISTPALNGVDVTKKTINKHPAMKICVSSMSCDEDNYFRMLKARSRNFAVQEAGGDALFRAILAAIHIEGCFSDQILYNIIIDFFQERNVNRKNHIKKVKLSKYDKDLLEQINSGYSDNVNIKNPGIKINKIEGKHSSVIIMSDANKNE